MSDGSSPTSTRRSDRATQLDPDLLSAVEKQAHKRGLAVETPINLWLQQKLIELTLSH